MKKFTSYIAMMMIALTSLTFTSCNDDEDIANTLWGVWKGEMYVTTYWGDYYYDASYSEIAFVTLSNDFSFSSSSSNFPSPAARIIS